MLGDHGYIIETRRHKDFLYSYNHDASWLYYNAIQSIDSIWNFTAPAVHWHIFRSLNWKLRLINNYKFFKEML